MRSPGRSIVPVLVVALALAASVESRATIDVLELEPDPPRCDEEFSVAVEGWFPDGCWSVSGVDFSITGSTLEFVISGVDGAQPGDFCPQWEIPYSDRQTVPGLSEGTYLLVAREEVISARDPVGDMLTREFTVCCAPAPPPVSSLRLEMMPGGLTLRFTWDDVAGASEYVLYRDLAPDGSFDEELRTATTGSTGIDLPLFGGAGADAEFFIVASRSDCAEGR